MNIFAIDPGNEKSAYVIWDGTRILDKGIITNVSLLMSLSYENGFGMNRPTHFVIEMVACYGMAVGKEVFETCLWIGQFNRQIVITYGIQPKLMVRRDVKMNLCHHNSAKDGNIRQAIIDRLGKPGTKRSPGVTYKVSKDLWAALGLALTYDDWLRGSSVDRNAPADGQRT